ncbi:MFS general substrate transporter [Flagelloscypha sp. PMI_526]|nr:MFS general substrate transporter [Flagelloscypha sp. PMI_526]
MPTETSPLLSKHQPPLKRTPLPWFQFSIVMVMQLAEPVTSSVIYPFAPDLIRRLGTPEENVGHYVGILQSLFFFTQSLTVLHWSRLSDLIGRKPVILSGLCGLSLSMYCFGLSKTFWGLVISRCLNGALNGNIGVMKSILAELTDATNVAQAVSWFPISWNTGAMLGPIIGGFLSRPAERFPDLFGSNAFLIEYPYFLACAVPASFSLLVFFIAATYFKETLKNPLPISCLLRGEDEDGLKGSGCEDGRRKASKRPKPLPFRKVLTKRVVLAGSAYAFLSLIDICYTAVQPTFLSTPIPYGGLGWTPSQIGRLLSIRAIINAVFQVCFFSRVHDTIGSKNTFLLGVSAFFPIFTLFKIINLAALDPAWGQGWVNGMLAIQVLCSLIVSMSYGTVMIYINSSAPNTRSIGATNGVCQMIVSIMRGIGPAAGNSLFSLTLQRGYLDGWLVYVVFLVFTVVTTWIGTLLPEKVWVIEEEEEGHEE